MSELGSTLISLVSSVPSHINALPGAQPKAHWSSSNSFTWLMLLPISQLPAERSLAQRKPPGPLGLHQVSRERPLSIRALQTANEYRAGAGGGGFLPLTPSRTCSVETGTSPVWLAFASQSLPQGLVHSACAEWMNKWKTELRKSCNTGTCRCC